MLAREVIQNVTLEDIPKILHLLPEAEQIKLLEDLDILGKLKGKEQAQLSSWSLLKRSGPHS